jgi:hypothetical protein
MISIACAREFGPVARSVRFSAVKKIDSISPSATIWRILIALRTFDADFRSSRMCKDSRHSGSGGCAHLPVQFPLRYFVRALGAIGVVVHM